MLIKQAVLEKRYACYGHFYSITSSDKEYRCRSVLEIVSVDFDLGEPNCLIEHIPDATVIMMNPGSSKPMHPQNIRIDLNDVYSMETSLVLTCPDDTQFQIMRIMEFKRWQHVRVLNLSDLRKSSSGKFYDFFPHVEHQTSRDLHSIFSKDRRAELTKKLYLNKPIIAAWGVSQKLNPLIAKCVGGVCSGFIGVKKENATDKYYHPLLQGKPMTQEKWLQKICKELGAK